MWTLNAHLLECSHAFAGAGMLQKEENIIGLLASYWLALESKLTASPIVSERSQQVRKAIFIWSDNK